MEKNASTIYQSSARQSSSLKALFTAIITADMQPKLLGLNGPMYNGEKILKSTGEEVAVIRYEKP